MLRRFTTWWYGIPNYRRENILGSLVALIGSVLLVGGMVLLIACVTGCEATQSTTGMIESPDPPSSPGVPSVGDRDVEQAIQSGLANVVARMEAAFIRMENNIASNINTYIGGGNTDTITSWIQAAGPWVAWILYPLVWRPIRRILNGHVSNTPDDPADRPSEA